MAAPAPGRTMPFMELDYALIADHAEITGGKLYLMGGGWDTFAATRFPAPVRFAVAAGVRVGWEETNRPIAVTMRLEDDDGKVLTRIEGTVQVGRAATLVAGSTQLAQIAAVISIQVERPGGHRVVVEVVDQGEPAIRRVLPFRLVQPQGQPGPSQPPPAPA